MLLCTASDITATFLDRIRTQIPSRCIGGGISIVMVSRLDVNIIQAVLQDRRWWCPSNRMQAVVAHGEEDVKKSPSLCVSVISSKKCLSRRNIHDVTKTAEVGWDWPDSKYKLGGALGGSRLPRYYNSRCAGGVKAERFQYNICMSVNRIL